MNESAGGLASERHFIVTFSRSARTMRRLGMGSSLAKCTDTLGASDNRKSVNEKELFPYRLESYERFGGDGREKKRHKKKTIRMN